MPSPAQLPVFTAEIQDGLMERIVASNRISMAAVATPSTVDEASLARIEKALGTNLNQIDLYYLNSILVSTGCNKNDDFFASGETWAARATPEDKPFNYEHNQDDIIGHITASVPVDWEGKVVAADEAPDRFHILTGAVIYRRAEQPQRQERIDKIIAEIPQGKWYVSMEALFAGFDYVLFPKDATTGSFDLAKGKVVERNESTAFLTKHLRAYGGSGVWQNQKIARALRNIVFCGKGLVRDPANPDSVIFCIDDQPYSGVAAKCAVVSDALGYEPADHISVANEKMETVMPDTNEMLQSQVADLTKKLDEAQAQLRASDTKVYESQVANLKAELTAAQEQFKTASEAAAKFAEGAKVAIAEVDATKAKLTAETARATELQNKLNDIETSNRVAARLVQVKAAYDLTDDTEASKILADIGEVSDEKFTSHVANVKARIEAIKAAAVKQGESKVSGAPAPMGGGSKKIGTVGPTGGKTSIAPVVKVATAETLDNVEATDTTAAAVSGEDNDPFAQLRDDVASYYDRAEKPSK